MYVDIGIDTEYEEAISTQHQSRRRHLFVAGFGILLFAWFRRRGLCAVSGGTLRRLLRCLRVRIVTLINTNTYTNANTCITFNTHTYTHTYTNSNANTATYTFTNSSTYTRKNTYTHSTTYTNSYTYTYTNTHTVRIVWRDASATPATHAGENSNAY